jgi:hypothetical protein
MHGVDGLASGIYAISRPRTCMHGPVCDSAYRALQMQPPHAYTCWFACRVPSPCLGSQLAHSPVRELFLRLGIFSVQSTQAVRNALAGTRISWGKQLKSGAGAIPQL